MPRSTPDAAVRLALFPLVLLLALPALVTAQDLGDEDPATLGRELTPAELKDRFEKKLARPFASKIPWCQSISEALERARKEKKFVLAVFTRSDKVHPPCVWLEERQLVADWWPKAAEKIVPYLNVRSGLEGQVDAKLYDSLGGDVWPFVVLLDETGALVTKVRLTGPQAFDRSLLRARLLRDLRRRATKNPRDAAAVAGVTILEATLDPESAPSVKTLEELSKTEGLDPRIKPFFAAYRVERQIAAVFERYQASVRGGKVEPYQARLQLQAECYQLVKRGLDLPAGHFSRFHLHFYAIPAALKAGDFDGARAALRVAKEELPNLDRAFGYFERAVERAAEEIEREAARKKKAETPDT